MTNRNGILPIFYPIVINHDDLIELFSVNKKIYQSVDYVSSQHSGIILVDA